MAVNLYIVGAGGLGRELLSWLKDSPDCGREWNPVGFLDDDRSVSKKGLPLPWMGTVEDFEPAADRMVVMGLGNSEPRRKVVQQLQQKGAKFLTYRHPSVIVGDRVEIGEGTVICPRCILTCDIVVGDFNFLNLCVTVGHDVRTESFVSISSQVDLCGGVVLEESVWIGSGARLIPGRRAGAGARIGAGAVVIRDVVEATTVFGNPAKRV